MSGSIAFSQAIIKNFPGVSLSDADNLGTGSTPPDTMGAAGPNHFAEFINGAFAVYNKAGTRLMLISDNQFWLNAGISSTTIAAGLTDTRLEYDPLSGRWFASEITLELSKDNLLVARSDSSDPTGTWKALFFTAINGGFDYDTLGVDSNAVYLAANMFSSGGSFLGVSFYNIPKADLIAATPTIANMTRFDNVSANTYGYTLHGVSNPGTNSGHGVIIAVDNQNFNVIDRTTVNNPAHSGATLSSTANIATADDSDYPNPAEQPGGKVVDTVDDRFTGSVRQIGGNIFMADTVLIGSRDAARWVVIRESDNALLGEGVISDTTYDYFQPTIAANNEGQILMAFNRSGAVAPAGDISIYGAVGSINGTTVTMGSPFLIKQGGYNNFGPTFDVSPYRWGDYSATMVDPTDDKLFWTIQEIPISNGAWGTQITLISLATNVPSLSIASTGANIQLSWPLSTDPAYVLQTSTALGSGAAWTAVGTAAAVDFNQNVVTLPIGSSTAFFRLMK